jgi:purine-nucleoside phosphorylase
MEPLETIRQFAPEAAIVLGSGLGAFVGKVNVVAKFPFNEIPGLPVSRVQGHAGELLLAEFAERRWMIYRGRVHLYEGWSAQDVTRNISLAAEMGCKLAVLTNAAGSLNVMHYPGTWMQITDQINLQGATPLHGGSRFLDMTGVYTPRYVREFTVLAQKCGITMNQGVYAGVLGPQYETPAEVRMLRAMGADAVGMSTVLEAIQARALDMEVVGFSCLSNWAAGIHQGPLNHEEVLATGAGAADQLAKLLLAWTKS